MIETTPPNQQEDLADGPFSSLTCALPLNKKMKLIYSSSWSALRQLRFLKRLGLLMLLCGLFGSCNTCITCYKPGAPDAHICESDNSSGNQYLNESLHNYQNQGYSCSVDN